MTDSGVRSLGRQIWQAGQDGLMAARLARDLPGWLRRPISIEEARARVRRDLARREERFLDVVARAIYENPSSPYLKLLRYAGCEQGDLERFVRQEGLEGTLTTLAGQGVYVTFDEFKGRREAVRGSARFHFADTEFDTPLVAPQWFTYTGGTRGTPTRIGRSLLLIDDLSAIAGSMLDAHGLADARHLFWVTSPICPLFSYLKLSREVIGWLIPANPFPLKFRLGARLLVLAIRAGGRRMPMPRLVGAEQTDRVLDWLARRPRDGRPLVFSTLTSMAVRLADAAQNRGVDLTDVTFRLQSEPLTDARSRRLRASGARVVDNYSLSEAQDIGFSCASSKSPSDLHFSSYRYALVERDRPLVDGGPSINAMLLTTLSDAAPKICLNTETGDYAKVEQRNCGCDLGALGLTTHLRDVRSFEKLSTEGVSFARTRLMQILEEVLPARFGGSPLDYQLLEVESAGGLGRLVLRVSPSVGIVDAGALRSVFLAELGSGGIADHHQSELLRRAGSVEISREVPLATGAGKVLPFHLVRDAEAAASPPL
jgi:hypothetical protein